MAVQTPADLLARQHKHTLQEMLDLKGTKSTPEGGTRPGEHCRWPEVSATAAGTHDRATPAQAAQPGEGAACSCDRMKGLQKRLGSGIQR